MLPPIYKLDLVIIIVAVLTFIFFLILHPFVFRLKKPRDVTREWIRFFLFASLMQLFLFLNLAKPLEDLVLNLIMAFILSWIIFGLLGVGFVIIIFGPSYSSIRIRLVQDLGLYADGIAAEDLAKLYNSETILKLRLERLLASRDLIQDGKFYCPSPQRSVFLGINSVVNFLKKIYCLC